MNFYYRISHVLTLLINSDSQIKPLDHHHKYRDVRKQEKQNKYNYTLTHKQTNEQIHSLGTIISEVPKAIKMTRKHCFFEMVEEVNTRCLF